MLVLKYQDPSILLFLTPTYPTAVLPGFRIVEHPSHPSSQWVIALVDAFFFIYDVKLLNDHFYSLSPRMLQRCVCVKGFTCAQNKLHYR